MNLRFSFAMMMALRRLQAVHVQEGLGMIGPAFTAGCERSVISAIATSAGTREWWRDARHAFLDDFVARVDRIAATEVQAPRHLGIIPEN